MHRERKSMPSDVSPWWAQMVGVGVGAFIGGASAVVSGVLTQLLTARREREAKEREAAHQRRTQWADFQIKVLMDTTEALIRMEQSASENLTVFIEPASSPGLPLEQEIKNK